MRSQSSPHFIHALRHSAQGPWHAGPEPSRAARHRHGHAALLLSRSALSARLTSLLGSGRLGTVKLDGEQAGAHDVDAWLLAVAERRDRAAFAALFGFYSPRLKGHLMARGAASATAEEIVQDVMLTVWHKAALFDAKRGSASAWLFTLVRNAFIDRVRSEHRPTVDPSDPLLDCSAPAVDQLLADAEIQRQLSAAVQALPAEQRHVVHLSYFKGQSLAQIAEQNGLPIGTVKTRARLALSRLRALVAHRSPT